MNKNKVILILVSCGFVAVVLLSRCTASERNGRREFILLGEIRDDKGRLVKEAVSGWDPGEDIWLRISRFDTAGNVLDEYGARPYGAKYRDRFTYDDSNRVTGKYCYFYYARENPHGDFENYAGQTNYELKDTLVDWRVTESQLGFKELYAYDDKKHQVRMRVIEMLEDSVTHLTHEVMTVDSTYRFDRKFDEVSWKSDHELRYEMTADIVESGMLLGKTKDEIKALLGNDSYNFADDHWRFYTGFGPFFWNKEPGSLDVIFSNGKVDRVEQHGNW